MSALRAILTRAQPLRPRSAARALSSMLFMVLVASALTVASAQPAAADSVDYQSPVDAPVVDGFRAPRSAYGPGNRGLEYDLPAHTAIRASAPGLVVFAGLVAGTRHVTIRHDDGRRSTYSFLESVDVLRGRHVDAGDVIGSGGTGFHFSIREGTTYVDPALLIAGRAATAHLVSTDDPLSGRSFWSEAAALARFVASEVSDNVPIVNRTVRAVEWIVLAGRAGLEIYDRSNDECTPDAVQPRADVGDHVVITVAGLTSSSDHDSMDDLDLGALGYDPSRRLRYSYAGGRIPTDGALDPALATIPSSAYSPEDTFGDIGERGAQLADLVMAAHAADPSRKIDLYAHSQGGLVTRVALDELSRRPGGLDAIGTVVTIATPHQGSELARVATAGAPLVQEAAGLGLGAIGQDLDPTALSVAQMAPGSEFLDRLDEMGVPDGVNFLAIGGRGDFSATADKTSVDGERSVVVQPEEGTVLGIGGHGTLPGSTAVQREISLALAGLPPGCRGLFEHVLDVATPTVMSVGAQEVADRLEGTCDAAMLSPLADCK